MGRTLSTLMTFIGLIFLTNSSQNEDELSKKMILNQIESERKFSLYKHQQYAMLVARCMEDTNKGALICLYDFDKDFIIDASAIYPIPDKIIPASYSPRNYAIEVRIDLDEDGVLDTIYRDGDNNGILETKEKIAKNME